ncbi:MAG: glycosyltransferase family 4 protein [Candidatus Hatepunaea meridiana]|nr:glycosyltransferase family 4 protein [Candidatus Hatepunaea meridiana]
MIIAEICLSPSWGGLEHYCADSAFRLTERGHTVLPIVRSNSPLEERLRKKGISPFTLRPQIDYFSPFTVIQLAHYFRKNSISSIHLHRTQDLGHVLLAADLAGVRSRILTLQMESNRKKRDIYHRWVYSRLTKVLTITKRMRNLLIDNVAVQPDKVQCLYYAIDAENFRSHAEPKNKIRQRWGVSEEAFVVGIVGRLEPLKGQEILLKAAAQLTDIIPSLVIMIVGDETVGQAGELVRLKRLAADLSPKLQVVFTGYQSPPGCIVPSFDVSVLATRKETFGLVILEAMALSVPVIATNAGGVLEIIENGVSGILVEPENPQELANALERLYHQPDICRKIAIAGRNIVETRFSLVEQIEGLEGALKNK